MAKATIRSSDARDVTINIRTRAATRALIDHAAQAQGKTRSEFMLEAARIAAEEALLDRRLFVLDDARWSAFQKALDAPAKSHARLKRLLREPGAFD